MKLPWPTDPNAINPDVASNKMQLGLVRQRQGCYPEAAALYDAPGILSNPWASPKAPPSLAELALVHKLNGQMNRQLQSLPAGAVPVRNNRRNRGGVPKWLGELGHLASGTEPALRRPLWPIAGWRSVRTL